MSSVPYRFTNKTPPVNPTDLDAEKFNANNDSLSSGVAISDRAIKNRHLDESSALITYVIKKFITTNDLLSTPLSLGLQNGDLVAINDISQNCGKIYIISAGAWVLYKNRTINLSVDNLQTETQYRLVLNNIQEYEWNIEAVINDNQTSPNTVWSSEEVVLFIASIRYQDDYFTGDGAASYSLSYEPVLNSDSVHVGGSIQERGVDYIITGTSLVFNAPVPEGIKVWVHYVYRII